MAQAAETKDLARVDRDASQPITPMEMLQIAVEKGTDLDQLQKLMDLHERWEANNARKAFVAAKAAFKSEAPEITKNRHVGFESRRTDSRTDYDYAPLDQIAEAVSPILSKHGLSYAWETDQLDGGLIRVTCILTHVLGHSERVSLQASPDQSGNKNPIQAIGSTITYLERYTLLAALGMATKEQDNDGGAREELIDEGHKARLIALMREVNADTAKFLNYLGIDCLDNLPLSRLNEATQALEAKRKNKGAEA